jgi:ABC-type glycerol-3-phosphate transport system substrate-binding protein
MHRKSQRVGLVVALVALVAAAAALARGSGDPVGKFPGASLTLSRWAGDPWEGATRTAATEWGSATGGSLKVDALPYENLHDKQVLQFAGHSGAYDLVYVHPSWFGEYVKGGYLKPIGAYLADKSLNPAGFKASSYYLPGIFKQGAFGGQQYCVQDFVATVLLAYRKDVFAKAHLAPPRSWAQVIADAKILNHKNGMAGIALPGKRTGAVADVLSTLLIGAGTWWYNSAEKASLDVNKATQAISFYARAAKYAPSGVLNFHWDEAATAAAQGKAAMLITLTPTLAWLNDPAKSKTVGKWGYVPLAATVKRPAGELVYWNWCVSSDSKDPKAAYSFIQWFTSGSEQAKVAVTGATAGSTTDFYTNKALLKKLPFLPAMNAAFKNTEPQPSLTKWPQIQDKVELAVQNAIQGKLTPRQAARSMRATLNAALG